MAGTLTWKGAQVSARVRQAAAAAVSETIDAAADAAAALVRAEAHDTGKAEESVRDHPRPVHVEGPRVRGSWGSRLWRFIFIEVGTVKMPAGHYLRRGADQEYPRLAGRIRGRLR